MTVRVAIYSRVSTDKQTCENQERDLRALAQQRGWTIVQEYSDQGISGAKDRGSRPGLHNMLRGAARGKFDMVVCWSLDRLGRSIMNLLHTLADLDAAGVNLYLHQQAIDTTTTGGRAIFQMMGVFAEFERSLIRERVKAGMARAKAQGKTPGPKKLEVSDPARYAEVKRLLAAGTAPWGVHRATGTGHSTVLRIRAEMEKAGELTIQQGDQ